MRIHGPKVLIVDDDPDTLGMLRLALGLEGFTVVEAPDASTALELLRAQSFNALIIDLAMPGRDGTSIIEALPSIPLSRDVPVFVITALCPDTPRERDALDFGAAAVLHKPFEPSRLVQTLIEHYACL